MENVNFQKIIRNEFDNDLDMAIYMSDNIFKTGFNWYVINSDGIDYFFKIEGNFAQAIYLYGSVDQQNWKLINSWSDH